MFNTQCRICPVPVYYPCCWSSQDRDYGPAVFKQCFVGSQAVDWMCEENIAGSREEAVAIGQRLVEFGLIDNVNSIFRCNTTNIMTVLLVFFFFCHSTTVFQ